MKTFLKFKGTPVDSVLVERALDSLYAFHSFLATTEKKTKKKSKEISAVRRYRLKYQVAGH